MDVCVESLDDHKPSKTLAGQMQFWGRGLRWKDYPALLFDRVNNWMEHGLPCSDREWTLKDRIQNKKSSERAPPTKQCPSCLNIHHPSPSCPDCGHVYEIKSREIDEVEGELVELTKEEREAMRKKAVMDRKQEQGRAQTLEDLIAVGRARKMRNPTAWAARVLAARMAKKGR